MARCLVDDDSDENDDDDDYHHHHHHHPTCFHQKVLANGVCLYASYQLSSIQKLMVESWLGWI